ncbi:tyramine oxidase subunit B [Sinomonas humi]|uniref:Ornithine cyclodeaminase n=1 Tax=Sinomonas humi TaxID=1338436 RepID=A0A0B2ATK5_9MICC|nr:tyramine oxidase subunit B [Sinomonas humi]KHL05320.1 ornithine cyclodeaminase [Sinomonas humi]
MGARTEFRYLSEADCIAAGVLDASRCVDVCEEVFGLLAAGDYLMGGPNHNSHGIGIVFPAASPFPNMPLAGPDRRFVAMPAYLGGRFDVCGNKWYGSNQANTLRGLPRSVLTLMLNDKDTGEPLTLMSANLISAARTGAVPAVASRHLIARKPEVLAAIGCGVINEAAVTAIVSQHPQLQRIVFHDRTLAKAQKAAHEAQERFGITAVAAETAQDCVRDADLVTIAASRTSPLVLRASWFRADVTILLSGPVTADEEFWTESSIIYDNLKLHEAYVEEAITSGDKQAYYDGVIGGPIYRLIDEGRIAPLEDSVDLGRVLLTPEQNRYRPSGRTVFVACGMAVFDIAWGYDLYQRALDQGIGQSLTLWEEPHAR